MEWQTSKLKEENRVLRKMFVDDIRNFESTEHEDEDRHLKFENIKLKEELLLRFSEIYQLLLKKATHSM